MMENRYFNEMPSENGEMSFTWEQITGEKR